MSLQEIMINNSNQGIGHIDIYPKSLTTDEIIVNNIDIRNPINTLNINTLTINNKIVKNGTPLNSYVYQSALSPYSLNVQPNGGNAELSSPNNCRNYHIGTNDIKFNELGDTYSLDFAYKLNINNNLITTYVKLTIGVIEVGRSLQCGYGLPQSEYFIKGNFKLILTSNNTCNVISEIVDSASGSVKLNFFNNVVVDTSTLKDYFIDVVNTSVSQINIIRNYLHIKKI